MSHVALVRRGHVDQVWMHTQACALDAHAYDGDLIEVEGDVVPGMRYENGVFLISPPRITPEQIKREAVRRADGVFPRAVQPMLAAQGGQIAQAMTEYLTGVHDTAQAFLALDAAPQDFCSDHHWPPVPSLAASSIPVAVPMLSAPSSPQEVTVRVVSEAKPITIEHVTDVNPSVTSPVSSLVMSTGYGRSNVTSRAPDVTTLDLDDDIAALKAGIERALQVVYDAHKGFFGDDAATHNAWLARLASFVAELRASTTEAGVRAVESRAKAFIAGG